MFRPIRRAVTLASTSLLALPAPVWASDAVPSADAGASGDSTINDVVVVARKRAESAQQVPIAITTLSGADLSKQNMVNFTNFQAKFPAFSVYLTNPKQLNLGIRGIGNNGFNTDGIDGSVGIFVDGVYTARQGMVSSDFNDIADVELLRGPQGTLFGKNTTAGAVIINTKKPSFTRQADFEGSVGNQGLREIKGSVTGPLVEGKIAARLSGYYTQTDGNYPNLATGGYQNARQGEGLRLQVLATPTDRLSIRVIGSWNHQGFNTMSPVVTSIYNPAALQARMAAAGYTLGTSDAAARTLNIDSPLNARTDTYSANATVDYDLGKAGSITAIASWEHWKCWTNNDNDYTQLNAIKDYGSCNNVQQESGELRWATPKGGAVEGTVGAFFSAQQLGVDSRILFGNQYNIWAANPSTTAFPTLGGQTWAQGAYANAVAGLGLASHAAFHTETQALFGNATWHPDAARRLSIDLGLRQTWEQRSEFYSGWVSSNTGNLSQTQINALSPSGANAQLGQVDQRLSDSALSGQAGLNYRLTPSVMLYATYARGYKSKGFNLLPINASNPDPSVAQVIALGGGQTVKGETADSFEGGVKSEWLQRHLLINLTAYHTLVRNYQANQAVGVGNTAIKFLSNVGSLTSNGVELESEAWLPFGLHAKGFIAYNHAYYSSFTNSVCPAQISATSCDLTGRQVAWAPKWTGDAALDYTHAITRAVEGYGLVDVNWRSSQNTTITLDPSAWIAPYALVNARAGVRLNGGKLDVQLWADNLLNKAYYINMLGLTKSTGLVQGYPGNPRSFGLRLRTSF